MVREANKVELRHVTTYVDVETYNKIESARGIYSRSSFVATVLMDVFSEIPANSEIPAKQEA